MWMKHDQIEENATGRPKEGLLRCPMCKGRGYFEPTEISNIKTTNCFPSETEYGSNNSVKLPRLHKNSDNKKPPQARCKFSLPSINKGKLINEQKPDDCFPDVPEKKNKNGLENDIKVPKQDSRKRRSRGLSVASSNDSSYEKHLIPSPKTPRNPSETLKISLGKLKTNNWNEGLNALREIIQLSRFQPHLIEPNMTLVYRGLIFLLKSFRSVVVRTACQASNELFATMRNTQRPEFDELVNVLLQKTADTNKAVRQDANEALDTMVIHIPPIHYVRTIAQKGVSHKSPVVRGAAARLLVCAVGVVGVDAVYDGSKESRGKVVNAAATFMQDGCQEVRTFGRRLMKMLMQHDDFDDVLQAEVNENLIKRIEKTLITMKYKS